MAEIKNPMAYFSTMVRNSYKTEYRSNDNFYKHISSVGDEFDIQEKLDGEKGTPQSGSDAIEQSLGEASAENWLLFMENERLQKALSSLLPADVQFLFALSTFDFKQTALARFLGVSQSAVAQRKKRIFKKILRFF